GAEDAGVAIGWGFRHARVHLATSEMKIKIAWIGKSREPAIQSLTDEYMKRLSRYAETTSAVAKDETGLLSHRKEKHRLVVLDSRGKTLASEGLAEFLRREQEQALPLLFAIGGADGFSDEARRQATFVLSLGKMTLPHELARVVLLEQLYRAFTILNHHPYH